ncbi:SAM-dependent methyltransferase [Myxococcota bacterium]
MTRKAAETGPGAMVLVAIEQSFPEETRIITDELAFPLLPAGLRINTWLMQRLRNWLVRKTEQKVPGLWGGIMARKRYIDDQVFEAATGRVEAVVNLGAGFDTRAYRTPALKDIPTWEIDLPKNIVAKRSRLEKLFQEVPSHVTLVPIDFDREALPTVLASHHYPFDKRTFFIWEGVTQYLTETGARSTFDFLAKAPSGSRLVFTYVPADFIEGKAFYGQDYLYKQMIQKDELWFFGIDPEKVEEFLGKYGWRVLEHLGYGKLADRYVRPTGRDLAAMEIERIVSAEKN